MDGASANWDHKRGKMNGFEATISKDFVREDTDEQEQRPATNGEVFSSKPEENHDDDTQKEERDSVVLDVENDQEEGESDNDNGNNGESTDSYSDSESSAAPVIDPPPSCGENFRDGLLRFLDRPEFQFVGIVVIFLVIADGALFFFLLVGWHGLCSEPSRTDCDPRNNWYNASVQILNILFTYMALQTISWRSTQFIHITGVSCPYRDHSIGKDLYGQDTEEVWYYIPRPRRTGILVLLIMNCVAQYINQGTRIYFNHYDLQDSAPGSIWTNVFFFLSMLCAALAGGWQGFEEKRLRNHNPGKFAPGPIDLLKESVKRHWRERNCCRRIPKEGEDGANEEQQPDEEEPEIGEDESVHVADAHTRFNLGRPYIFPHLPFDRTDLRLWAM